ncbi:MAG: hypothetical protein HC785_13945 [Calothrix sp. CSU_2_0]|nr:hypothetical protein [Calothrix sp. CSU_2_0]
MNKKHREWQQQNADKTRAYTAKYQENKIRATVILSLEIAEKIDKIKPPEQSYGGWIRELVESYVDSLE